MRDLVLHLGHCFRSRGATGTAGHRGSEQQFVATVGPRVVEACRFLGIDAVTCLADAPIPTTNLFVALHQDGSTNPNARGASMGYPAATPNRQFAQLWKAHYTLAGWPSGFRPDNYTRALRNYYGYRRAPAKVKVLVEHGFATNQVDDDWMWDNLDKVVQTHLNAVTDWLGVRPPPPPIILEDEMAITVNYDPASKSQYIFWNQDGKPAYDKLDDKGTNGVPIHKLDILVDLHTGRNNWVRKG